jgi:Trypsin
VARLSSLLALTVAAAVAVSPASAITGGAIDTSHDYAGALVIDGRVACSGVLVSPTVFLTARHCIPGTGSRVDATFDERLDPGSWTLRSGTAHAHPTDDVAAVVLDEPVAEVASASLPAAGSAAGVASVVAVGYGYHDVVGGAFLYDGFRRAATIEVKKESADVLVVSNSKSGGVCFGDSGGPHLSGNTVLALTSAGHRRCNGPAEAYRLDTPSARSFLAGFVTLP